MVNIPEIKLKKTFIKSVIDIVGEKGLSTADIDRFSYSRDANFRSTLEAHYSSFGHFPSLIVWPTTPEQISKLIILAGKDNVAVTPYGGGSGVSGGAISYEAGMIIDTKKMQRFLKFDPERLFVEVEAGILGMELEKKLNRKGFTLGHFPSSILCACLGGFIASRSAGQYSSKYGKIEDMIIDLEFVDGNGVICQTADVSRQAGIDLTQMIVGTEGSFGIITKARLKISPLPQNRVFKSFIFNRFEYGIESIRRIMQTGLKPDALRLYDELETALVLSKISRKALNEERLSHFMPGQVVKQLKKIKSSALTIAFNSHKIVNKFFQISFQQCALITVLEGHSKIIDQQAKIIASICNDLNAVDIGEDSAMHWFANRYSVSYAASGLFRDGAFVDTFEAATTWDNIPGLYLGVKKSLKSYCFVLAHIAHAYEEGAAVYFTIVSPLTGLKSSLKKFDKIWKTALDAVQQYGGVMNHHHGIGSIKRQSIMDEWGDAAFLYKNFKDYFDPHGIMNPRIHTVD
ncbi:MAG: FAD-binding oxidoreductase [Deltaproteobacteria bacterium]|nr:FAD-binding oxidoreductase [Deltaproteobacteria bacterium]